MQKNADILAKAIFSSLDIIEQDREREIISRRFGLNGPKETLEQIGEMLSITRERVRQLEKAILIHLKISAGDGSIEGLAPAEKLIIRNLVEMGRIAKISDLATRIFGEKAGATERAHLAFIGEISSGITLVNDNDRYFAALSIADYGNEKDIRSRVDEIVKIIKEAKTPLTIDDLDNRLNYEHPDHIKALASISRNLAHLGDLWGLTRWPTVNPKNIRDKIYVILEDKHEPMHFSDIAESIQHSDFKRKNVTTQAIHNELIKDKRFVLIGRGIYALDSWGYAKGTVAEIIARVLGEHKNPMSREEVVREVLKLRKVKETTILLNLQNKKHFKKLGKDSFTLADK